MEARTQWKQIAGWSDYEISKDGIVRRISSGQILAPRNGQVRLAWSRTHRTWRKVDNLMLETFGKPYVSPCVSSMSEPGEEWKRITFAPEYMVSSHRRVWSWKTSRFVGNKNVNGKMDVLFSIDGQYKKMNIDKIYAMHFGYTPPTEPGEEWRRLPGYPGIAVSNMGRVWSDWYCDLLKGTIGGKGGYLTISHRKKSIRVHRLVAMAFIPNDDVLKTDVDHINEDKTDNRVENLRWCTPEENTQFYLDNHPGAPRIVNATSL